MIDGYTRCSCIYDSNLYHFLWREGATRPVFRSDDGRVVLFQSIRDLDTFAKDLGLDLVRKTPDFYDFDAADSMELGLVPDQQQAEELATVWRMFRDIAASVQTSDEETELFEKYGSRVYEKLLHSSRIADTDELEFLANCMKAGHRMVCSASVVLDRQAPFSVQEPTGQFLH